MMTSSVLVSALDLSQAQTITLNSLIPALSVMLVRIIVTQRTKNLYLKSFAKASVFPCPLFSKNVYLLSSSLPGLLISAPCLFRTSGVHLRLLFLRTDAKIGPGRETRFQVLSGAGRGYSLIQDGRSAGLKAESEAEAAAAAAVAEASVARWQLSLQAGQQLH